MMDHNQLLSPEELGELLRVEEENSKVNKVSETVLMQRVNPDLKEDVVGLIEVVRLLQMRVEFLENLLQGHLKAEEANVSFAAAIPAGEDKYKHKRALIDSEKHKLAEFVPTAGLTFPPRSERHARG